MQHIDSRRTRIAFSLSAFFLAISPLVVAISTKAMVLVFALATIAMITGAWQDRAELKGLFQNNRPVLLAGMLAAALVLALAIVDLARGGANADDAFQMVVMLLFLLSWPLFGAKVTDVAVWFVPVFLLVFVIAFAYVQIHLWLDVDLFSVFHSEDEIEALWVFNNAIVALVLFSWVFAPSASAALKPILGLLIVLIAWVLSFFSESEAAIIGMAAGLTVYIIARFLPRLTLPALMTFLVLLLIASPWVFAGLSQLFLGNPELTPSFAASPTFMGISLSPAFAERAELWQVLPARIFEDPAVIHGLLGHGVDFLKQNHFVPEGANFISNKDGLIHPHSIYLQAWLDGGVLMVAALLALLLMIGLLVKALGPHMSFAAMGLLVSGLLIALVTHSLFSDWWFANLALAGIVFKVFNENLTGQNV